MRTLFFLALMLPLFSSAQINRSAKELAGENIQDYIVKKLFKGQSYKSVSYGELKVHLEKERHIAWALEHRFEVAETRFDTGKKTEGDRHQYKFLFYLDDKMQVKRAESYYVY